MHIFNALQVSSRNSHPSLLDNDVLIDPNLTGPASRDVLSFEATACNNIGDQTTCGFDERFMG